MSQILPPKLKDNLKQFEIRAKLNVTPGVYSSRTGPFSYLSGRARFQIKQTARLFHS